MSISFQESNQALTMHAMQFNDSFLQQVIVSERSGAQQENCDLHVCDAVDSCWASGQASVVSGGETSPAIACLPIWKTSEMIGVVAFVVSRHSPLPCGVLEVWSPTGEYQDLALTSGYFGELDRFQNVSSFVRFERGSGLPGQAWDRGLTVIHDDLKNHPGFLRAAGASADSLETAIGIPLIGNSRAEAVVIISSCTMPFARACEVWTPCSEAGLSLEATSVPSNSDVSDRKPVGDLADEKSFAAFIASQKRPVLSADSLFKDGYADSQAILGIPTFVDGELTCVTVLVF